MATEWTKQLAQQHSQNLKHQPNHKLFNRCMERCIQILGEAGGSSAFSSNPALLWLVSGMNRFYAFEVSLD